MIFRRVSNEDFRRISPSKVALLTSPSGNPLRTALKIPKISSIKAPFDVFRDENGERSLASVKPTGALRSSSFCGASDFTRRPRLYCKLQGLQFQQRTTA
jgi:hypothetical protein